MKLLFGLRVIVQIHHPDGMIPRDLKERWRPRTEFMFSFQIEFRESSRIFCNYSDNCKVFNFCQICCRSGFAVNVWTIYWWKRKRNYIVKIGEPMRGLSTENTTHRRSFQIISTVLNSTFIRAINKMNWTNIILKNWSDVAATPRYLLTQSLLTLALVLRLRPYTF